MINLSEIPNFWKMSVDDIILYLLDNNKSMLVDDFSDNKMIYSIDDLEIVWDNIRIVRSNQLNYKLN